MKFTIRAKAADDIAPMIVATEDPTEARDSVRAFGREKLVAVVGWARNRNGRTGTIYLGGKK